MHHIPEEEEHKTEKKNNKQRVSQLDQNKEIKPEKDDNENENENEKEEAKDEPEAEEESEEYESEDEDIENYKNESLEVMQLANERKILDEQTIMNKYNLTGIAPDKLQEYKLKYIND